MNKSETGGLARFVLRVEFIPYVVFTVIGAAVLYTLGTIGIGALQNGSLLPPPTKLNRYECSAAFGDFSVVLVQGTDRVKIKSINGSLDGTVQKNRFDWQGFANDRAMLGFAPPAEILFEDGNALRIAGPDYKDMACTKAVESPGQRPAVSQ